MSSRLARQEVLDRSHPPQFVAVLDQTVLERPVGGPKVAREQLLHPAEMGRRPQIHLHVVPKGAGGYAGLRGAFVLATPLEGDDVAYLDNQLEGTVVERPADVLRLRQMWESVRAEAMSKGQTLTVISEAATTWT